MPYTDLVRHLNAQHNRRHPQFGSDPFVATADGVFAHFANLRLESAFVPIQEAASGRVQGHAAVLLASGLTSRRPVDADAVFVLPADDAEFVFLDRLVRTLHTLNYLTRSTRGNLLLKVHRRHVLSVPTDHGLAFEEILRPCGLVPDQITLELDGDGLAEASNHFLQAAASYQRRGYGLAISRFGKSSLDFALLRYLRPDIVKLDPLLVASARPLERIIANLQALGARVLVAGPGERSLRRFARATGVDFILAEGAPVSRASWLAQEWSRHPTTTQGRAAA